MDGTDIALTLFLFYWITVIVLDRKGILKKYNISSYGPILMIRTTSGLKLIDRLAAPKKPWRLYADIGIRLMFIGMIAMFLVIMLSNIALLTSFGNNSMPEPGKFHEARNIFLIPGVNEFIPLTWGILALVITLIVHEFSHAILCRVENIRVKSMGILLALVPIGGFAEPDEEELFGKREEPRKKEHDPYGDRRLGINVDDSVESLSIQKAVSTNEKKASRKQRSRILAAGVMANFVVALLAFSLLFGPVLGAFSTLGDSVIVGVDEDSPAYAAGIREKMVITQIDDTRMNNVSDMLNYLDAVDRGKVVTVYAAYDREISSYDLEVIKTDIDPAGLMIQEIVDGAPADIADIEEGMRIVYIDSKPIRSYSDFQDIMDQSLPDQKMVFTLKTEESEIKEYTVTLAEHPDIPEKGFLGVMTPRDGKVMTQLGIEVAEFPATAYLDLLKSIPKLLMEPAGWIILLGLPIIGFAGEGFPGFSENLAQFYEPVGWAEPLGMGLFWLANALLWIGWLNFYVGLFNCLPAVPLDGGHIFRDYMSAFISRITGNEQKAENLASLIAIIFALTILISFLFMIFGPYIVHGL